MQVTIDTNKLMKFVAKHKEAIGVALIAAALIRIQKKNNQAMLDYINTRGLAGDYLKSIGK